MDLNKIYMNNITPESCIIDTQNQPLKEGKIDEQGGARQPGVFIAKENVLAGVPGAASESNSKAESRQQLRWSEKLPLLPS